MADDSSFEVPSANDAKEGASKSITPMMEGAAAGLGIEIGGSVLPVVGELAGGYGASLVTRREGAKTFTRRLAAYKATEHLLM